MTKQNHRDLLRNISKNKGYRFTSETIVGGGFFGDIVKNVGKKVAKTFADKGLDYVGQKTGQKGITNALKGSIDGLVDVAADRISGGKLTKGSPEMRERMAKLRAMRKGKGMIEGGNVFYKLGRDIKNGFNQTFNANKLTSGPAREIHKGIADARLSLGSSFTGLSLGLAKDEINRQIDGASIKKRRNVMVVGGTLVKGVPMVQIRGKGFRGTGGTQYGGNFRSPTSGGSFSSP